MKVSTCVQLKVQRLVSPRAQNEFDVVYKTVKIAQLDDC